MIKTIYRRITHKPKQVFIDQVGDCESLLDLGCSYNSRAKYLPKTIFKVGVDSYEPYIKQSKHKNIHNDYINIDFFKLEKYFKKHNYGKFDCVCCMDVIEHLSREDGFKLIDLAQRLASKKVIIGTPNGFMPQKEKHGNELQEHISGWAPKDFQDKGFKVIGCNGLKSLRDINDSYRVIGRPEFLYIFFADILSLLTDDPDDFSYLTAVKEIKNV